MKSGTVSRTPTWIVPVSVVALILGFLLVSAWKGPHEEITAEARQNRADTPTSPPIMGQSTDEREAEIAKLREEVTLLQNAVADQSRQSKVLNDSLQEAKLLACLTEVEGPGIVLILRDSEKVFEGPLPTEEMVIHDKDVQTAVNELWLSGAEAISINHQRVALATSFYCAGPIIYVGRKQISSPVTIRAIGDTDTLYGALTMRGRFLDEFKYIDPAMIEVRKKDHLVLPAHTGSTEFHYAKTVTVDE
ncbi:MAG: DUF881 domain-containing protein [Armatimonadetes bacterium]|nr:DUF881 domain-containing protein [Armatimonadota bacterium]